MMRRLGCAPGPHDLYFTMQEVRAAKEAGVVAFKLYPAGATTNSASGVTDIELVMPTLHAMAEVGGK